MPEARSRSLIQRNIILFKGLVLLKATAFILRHYILLSIGRSTSFWFFAGIYGRELRTKMLRLSPAIPYVELEDVFPGIGSVLINTLGKFNSFRPGAFTNDMGFLVSAHELQVLCALVKQTNPAKIVEIGTHQGWTIANLALNAPPGCEITTLDISSVTAGNAEIQKIFESSHINFITVDSTKFDFSPFYGAVDFIFIDGSHLEADVEKDSEAALKMISSRGVIVWHDHNLKLPGVVNCLHRLSEQISICHILGTTLAFHNRGEDSRNK